MVQEKKAGGGWSITQCNFLMRWLSRLTNTGSKQIQ